MLEQNSVITRLLINVNKSRLKPIMIPNPFKEFFKIISTAQENKMWFTANSDDFAGLL